MRVAILEKPGRITIEERPLPEPGAGDVVVRVRAALTCGTDLKAYRRGHPKMPCPTPFGHEFAGEIAAAGSAVRDFRVGDPVMAANTGPCGTCIHCRRDQENLCESIMDEMILGAYADYVLVPERVLRANLFRKPDGLAFEHAALLEPLASVCFGLAHLPAFALGEDATVVILGAGPIAMLWLMALKAAGTPRVVVAGRRPARLAIARAVGADETIGEGEDVAELVRRYTHGAGADAVVECTGLAEVWEQALAVARRGATVVLFGGCAAGTRAAFDTYRLHYDGVQIASPFHFRPRDVRAAYDLLASGAIDGAAIVRTRARLEELPQVFRRLGEGRELKCAILPGGPAEG